MRSSLFSLGIAAALFAAAPAEAQEATGAAGARSGDPEPTAAPVAPGAPGDGSSEGLDEPDPEPSGEAPDAAPETPPSGAVPSDESPAPPSDGAPAAPRPAGPQLTFANSFFTWTTAATAHTFAPGAQLSYDPTVVMSFGLTPRFYLTDTTFLWLNQSMALELTDSNWNAHNREPILADTLLDLRQILLWEGFVFQAQGRLAFPSSKLSQAARRYVQTGLGLTIARPIPEAAGLTLAVTGAYRRWWAGSNVSTIARPDRLETERPDFGGGLCLQPSAGELPVCTQAGGLTNARDLVIAGLTMNVAPFSGFTVSFSGFFFATYNYDVSPGTVEINGGPIRRQDDGPTHWRPFTYFALAVAYDVLPWLNLQLGVQNSGVVAPLYDESGNVRSPLSPDTQVFFTTTLGLDSLFGEVVGGGEDDGLTPEERQRRRQGLASTGSRSAF